MANTNFRESGVDIINKYISQTSPALGFIDDVYLTDAGKILKYGYLPNTLWSWGENGSGQLGLDNITDISSPVQVGALNNWSQISGGGAHSLAVKTDGTLWAWGRNTDGQLGLGHISNRSSPVQVGSLTDWSQVVGGYTHSLSIKTDGTLWSWGLNNKGQLGLGNITHRSSPVQVGALTDWSQVAGGYEHSLALKTNSTLWAWGENQSGQLGLGDTTDRSSPVQVGALTDWSKIAGDGSSTTGFSLAVKTDGTLWSWGVNTFGQLGLGNTTGRLSPVQVGALTDWSKIDVSTTHSLALKTDGTLWAWGRNVNGQLGLGDTTNISSPVQVGLLTDWLYIAASGSETSSFSLAIKTDGTLWAWGDNTSGKLGLGDIIDYSSPVQVGNLTDWSKIAAGDAHSLALVG